MLHTVFFQRGHIRAFFMQKLRKNEGDIMRFESLFPSEKREYPARQTGAEIRIFLMVTSVGSKCAKLFLQFTFWLNRLPDMSPTGPSKQSDSR